MAQHRVSLPLYLPTILFIVALVLWPLLGQTLRHEQKGFILYNPLMIFLKTSVEGLPIYKDIERTDIPEEAFFPPQDPIAENYPDSTKDSLPPEVRLDHPNILVVFIESFAYEYSPYGRMDLPIADFFNELHDGGVVFHNFRTVFPSSSRSFLAFLCADYPNTGFYTITKVDLNFQCPSILQQARRKGYRTGFFQANRMYFDNFDKARIMADFDVREDLTTLKNRSKIVSPAMLAVEEEIVIDALEKFIREQKEAPFFGVYYPFWTHAPYALPFDDISSLPPFERYKKSLAYINDSMKRLMIMLKRNEKFDNTVIVVTADHGEGFGAHGNYLHQGGLYEEDVKLPLVIKIPGVSERYDTSRSGSMIDLAPTITRIAELDRPAEWTGQDLLATNYRPRPHLIFSRMKSFRNGLMDGHYKFFYDLNKPEKLILFDVAADPAEKHNIAEEHDELAEEYRVILEQWLPWHNSKLMRMQNRQKQ